MEAYVQCPLKVVMKRDPKGIYQQAASGEASFVPGVQVPYEPPLNPEVTLDGQLPPDKNAAVIVKKLEQRRLLSS